MQKRFGLVVAVIPLFLTAELASAGSPNRAVKRPAQLLGCGSGIGASCSMPDGCPGIKACVDDMVVCTYLGTGSTSCSTCGSGGRRQCTSNGPGPCMLTTTCSQGCGTGSQSCTDGVWTQCTGCSGQVRYCNPCQPGVIADTCTSDCRSTNPTCALAEVCNGCDDDRDGYIDNRPGVAAANTLNKACSGPSAECTGTSTCVYGTFQSCTSYTGSKSCTNWCGDAVAQSCDYYTGVLGACPQRAEVCNGLDDNCNGQIDESSVCQQGSGPCATPPCGDGICAPGETSTSCPSDCH